MLQLNPKGSHLSVVHGMTGYFMVNRTDSIANVFEQLRNFTDPCKYLLPFYLSVALK